MFWTQLLAGIMKRPWIIALIVMGVIMGGMWVNINMLKGDIVDLRADIVAVEKNYNTCKGNEVTFKSAIDQCNDETDEFVANVTLLDSLLVIEKARVAEWRDKYNNKVCYKPSDEIVVIKKDEVRVLNDEANVNAIGRINTILGN